MKHFKGFSVAGLIAVLAIVAFLGIATYFVVDNNLKATDYNKYDFWSYIGPDEHNGYIGDHVKGNLDTAVAVIFEYADPQCPGCSSMNPRINAALEAADGRLAVIYRNDIMSYHQNGTAAASAAEAAGLQGYWKEYIDLLFTNQADWEYATSDQRTVLFEQYFAEVTDGQGDLDRFRADLASKEVSAKIKFDIGLAQRVGVPATPGFYVDGQYIDWVNKDGGSIDIDGKILSWETTLTGDQFQDMLGKIVEAKLAD